jgi:hypothetical protein
MTISVEVDKTSVEIDKTKTLPREHSSGGRRRLGSISKQDNRFMPQWLVEAVQTVNQLDEGFCNQYSVRCHHKAKAVAKMAYRPESWRCDSTGCCGRTRGNRSLVARQ